VGPRARLGALGVGEAVQELAGDLGVEVVTQLAVTPGDVADLAPVGQRLGVLRDDQVGRVLDGTAAPLQQGLTLLVAELGAVPGDDVAVLEVVDQQALVDVALVDTGGRPRVDVGPRGRRAVAVDVGRRRVRQSGRLLDLEVVAAQVRGLGHRVAPGRLGGLGLAAQRRRLLGRGPLPQVAGHADHGDHDQRHQAAGHHLADALAPGSGLLGFALGGPALFLALALAERLFVIGHDGRLSARRLPTLAGPRSGRLAAQCRRPPLCLERFDQYGPSTALAA
jgi:hypothetical protein